MNMSNITGWAKSHPWTTGAVVIGGGLTFILLSGWFTGDSSSASSGTVSASGPSDSQLAAQAQISGQQIAANVANNQTSASLKAAELQASLASKLAELDYSARIAELAAGTQVSLADISSQQNMFTIQNQTAKDLATIDAMVTNNYITADTNKTIAQINSNDKTIEAVIAATRPAVVEQPKSISWTAYLQQNPDVGAAWTSGEYAQVNNPEYADGGVIEWAQHHYYTWGLAEGRQLPTV